MVLTYYAPYVSGLTDSARRLAEGLAARGRRVAVVTTRHDRALPPSERINGVDVTRCAVMTRISKGTVSPTFALTAAHLAQQSAVVHLHAPMLEAGLIARLIRHRAAVVTTYYCDVNLGPSLLDRVIVRTMDRSSTAAIAHAAKVAVLASDYAESSRLRTALRTACCVPIPPPCEDRRGGSPSFRETEGVHVGFVGRMVEEKGVAHLVTGFRRLRDPDARLLLAGDHSHVAGGSVIAHIRAAAAGDPRIRFLGFVPDAALRDLYASIDVLALPSVNSLEAFGIVQAEAMMCGVPVVASDLPGVRVPILTTGMGLLTPPGDADAIADALQSVVRQGASAEGPQLARATFGSAAVIDAYDDLYSTALAVSPLTR